MRQVVYAVGTAEQVTETFAEEATVKVFAVTYVTLKIPFPLMDVAPPLKVPPETPLRVTPVVTPAGKPCGAVVVTVHGVPMEMDSIWKAFVTLIGTVNVVESTTVAVFPPELIETSENFPLNPRNQIVFDPVMPCGLEQVKVVGDVVGAERTATSR
jgi:hypothetical protein